MRVFSVQNQVWSIEKLVNGIQTQVWNLSEVSINTFSIITYPYIWLR